ncbi:MAG: DUF1905 domain-containing protein [Cyclobacteriaceae bacterium]
MNEEKPLIDAEYLLKKSPGKGGWTYAEIPRVLRNKNSAFGWVRVKGSIDGFELKQYKLMPMGNGKLFLPVKAEIRKKIKKQEGDYVKVVLFSDESSLEIPAEIVDCLKNESNKVYETFLSLTEGEQKAYLDWIYSAKTDETMANRIIAMTGRVNKGLKLHDQTEVLKKLR